MSPRHVKVIDEHHEAYLCIEEAFGTGLLAGPVALVHVDAHDDLGPSTTTASCHRTPARTYAEQHLNVGSYLTPLLLRGRIDRVVWVTGNDSGWRRRTVGSVGGAGKTIRVDVPRQCTGFYPDLRRWRYRETSDVRRIGRLAGSAGCVLNIDCDFFSANAYPRRQPGRGRTSGRSGETGARVTSDDEYRIRLHDAALACEPTGRPLVFNDSRLWINLLIDYLTGCLRLEPALVLICRSLKSGFTPARHGPHILARLLDRLRNPKPLPPLPRRAVLGFAKDVVERDGVFFSGATGRVFDRFNEGQLLILKCISRGLPLGAISALLQERYLVDEAELRYELLRFIFNLKRAFILA